MRLSAEELRVEARDSTSAIASAYHAGAEAALHTWARALMQRAGKADELGHTVESEWLADLEDEVRRAAQDHGRIADAKARILDKYEEYEDR